MKVLFVSYTGEWTGPTNSLLQLVRQLRPRFNVAVLLPGDGMFRMSLAREGIEHHVFSHLSKWAIPRIVRLARRESVDVVYANNTHGSSRNAAVAALLTGLPFVCHVRGVLTDASWKRLWYLRTAAAVIAVSSASASAVRPYARPDRLRVVYNGVPEGYADTATDEEARRLRRELMIPENATVIASVGHLKPLKGQEHAIRAFRLIAHAFPEVHLVIAGSHDRNEAYVERVWSDVSEWGLTDRVHLPGFCSNIPALLKASELYLHSSLSEAHPRSVLEAMAFGLPVVAFAVGGVAETVVDEVTGRLVPAGDYRSLASALELALRDPDQAAEMGRRGQLAVRCCFNADATGEQIGEILEAL